MEDIVVTLLKPQLFYNFLPMGPFGLGVVHTDPAAPTLLHIAFEESMHMGKDGSFGIVNGLHPEEEPVAPVAPLVSKEHEASRLAFRFCKNEESIVDILKNVLSSNLKVFGTLTKFERVRFD